MKYNHLDMLPELAFKPVGKRMTLEGGGGGGSSTSQTTIDPILKPYVSYGLQEAKNLYQGDSPQYYAGQTYIAPSANTLSALSAAGNRAMAGNPLLPAAQANLQNLQTAYNPATGMYNQIYNQAGYNPSNAIYGNAAMGGMQNAATNAYSNLYNNAATDPSTSFYQNMAAGNMINPATGLTSNTASGGYLQNNPYFNQAISGAGQAATQTYLDAIKQAQGGAAQAGRYGSGVSADIQNRAANTLANTLANKYGELAYGNYANERAMQEAAQGRLGTLSQQDIANQLTGAQNLTAGGQQTFANQLAAAGGIGNISAGNIATQLAGAAGLSTNAQNAIANRLNAAQGLGTTTQNILNTQLNAAQLAPELANADYTDINQLLKTGQAQEDYANTALQADINRFNYNENLPTAKLNQYAQYLSGTPQGSTTTSSQSSSKIVCSMMNESYGIGSFRNRVWIAQSARMPNAKTIEKGYHTLFLPLVAFAKGKGTLNRAVKHTLEHIAKHRTADVYKEMRNGKRDTLGRIYRNILEPICYVVGKVKGA